MKLSANGLAVLHYFEKCVLTAYPDPGSRDGTPWTIGWGHTGPEVCEGLCWSQKQADDNLEDDLLRHERGVEFLLKVEVTQGQFDALVLFAYNCGFRALAASTLLRKLNAHDTEGARHEFPRWDKNDGKVMLGLKRRRRAEVCLFIGASAAEAIAAAKELK